MRIAIIGNSHIGALKIAMRDGQFKTDKFEVTFWGVPGHCFSTVTYADGHFRTAYRNFVLKVSEGLHESLPAHDFDAIVFHGPPLNVERYLTSLRHVSDDLRCYSRACLHEALQKCIEAAPGYDLVRSLRTEYGGRVLMSPMPLISEDSAQFSGRPVRVEELTLLNSCIAAILADLRAEYVAQPPDTVRDYKYTKREFCVNSVGVFYDIRKHPEDDYFHMNGQYGACVLHQIAAQLEAGGVVNASFAETAVNEIQQQPA